MKIIKILHVGLSPNMGGIENVVRSWNKMLPENIKFDFINNSGEPLAFQNEFECNECRIFPVISRKDDYMKSYKQIKSIINEGHYDYVQHHMMSFSWPEPLMAAQKSTTAKAIAHCHTAGSKDLSVKYRILDNCGRWRLGQRPYLKLACGDVAGRDMFHSSDFTVIKNGVDFSGCAYDEKKRNAIRNQYGISRDAYVIGHVGRIGNAKNYPFIVELFYDLIKIKPDSVLLLIGNVSEDEKIRKLVREKDLGDKVVFTGALSDIKGYYSAMDVFILPSLYEGVSVAMIEAQVAGLSCVVSEFVSKDADISGNVRYVSIANTKEGVAALAEFSQGNRKFECLNIDHSYDLKFTADQMFQFYEKNL